MSTKLQSAPWFANEDALALHAIPSALPRRSTGRPVTLGTIYKWTTAGVRGVRLRRFRAGGRGFCTTKQELTRFLAALAALDGEAV